MLDAWSRRVIGWAIGEQMTTDLMLAALNMAIAQRKPRGVIHHSDQSSLYTNIALANGPASLAYVLRWTVSATRTREEVEGESAQFAAGRQRDSWKKPGSST